MASFDVHYDEERDFLISCLEGKVDFETVKNCAKKISETGDKYQCKYLLNDLRKAEIDFSLIDFIEITKILIKERVDSSWKRALVVANKSIEYRFYETVSVEQAINLKLFTNPYEAINWLIKRD